MSTTSHPNSIVAIEELRSRREQREERARNLAATEIAILTDRIRADLVTLRRKTDAETVARFLEGRIAALGGPQ